MSEINFYFVNFDQLPTYFHSFLHFEGNTSLEIKSTIGGEIVEFVQLFKEINDLISKNQQKLIIKNIKMKVCFEESIIIKTNSIFFSDSKKTLMPQVFSDIEKRILYLDFKDLIDALKNCK